MRSRFVDVGESWAAIALFQDVLDEIYAEFMTLRWRSAVSGSAKLEVEGRLFARFVVLRYPVSPFAAVSYIGYTSLLSLCHI